jgi:hypothetical protein
VSTPKNCACREKGTVSTPRSMHGKKELCPLPRNVSTPRICQQIAYSLCETTIRAQDPVSPGRWGVYLDQTKKANQLHPFPLQGPHPQFKSTHRAL